MGWGRKVDKILDRKGRDFNFPNASKPCHDRAEFCFEKMPEKLQDVGKEPDKGAKKPRRKGATPTSAMALKPFNSCTGNFFSTNPAGYQARTKGMWLITNRSGVHPNCKNASNPYHKCAEYCLKNIPNKDIPGEENSIDASTNTDKSSPFCNHIRASIPDRKDVGCCFKNTPEEKHPHKEIKTLVAAENEVKCECKNAPPSQLDDEYCFQNLCEDRDLQAVKKAKEEMVHLHSRCQFASNPYHDCSADCFQNELDQNKAEEESEPICNNVESTVDIILEDRIEKSSKDSKFVEASNPDIDNTEFYKEITVQVVTTDLIPEVETKITKEPSDVQPLQLDASDLFLEWAKYCSQEMRASETKNDQEDDDLKYCNSANIEKVKAEGSLRRSLPTSLLFVVGFLFALFKWTQMIHTLVMCSERKKKSSGGVTLKRLIGSN